ncbi:MAG: undecaprenyl/decaprenyl-phosphate alpha-N-acetylglucosaminyl 1-phosphate transferase [Chitinophagaceae bacterium]|jgi:UDP-GlcNAc:undecaprenyl-phosphate GlcNAc-1-phosphate transferase|nr:undecaprenyl/decaprenyl-phosphate alpha-N-acetylglucosaminyl 1-phosphate transferase [Chitinophagaceae bacterium]
MQPIYREALIAMAAAMFVCAILMPLLIKWSVPLRLVDQPNERKLHKKPIPSIGGLVMGLSLLLVIPFSPAMQQLMQQYWPVGWVLLALMLTGVLDDRLNLPAMLRLGIQVGAGVLMAYNGIRLHSLHGLFGIYDLPIGVQYFLTVLLIAGITNAFNLIDGIDGLAGSLAIINVAVFAVLAVLLGQQQWLALLLPYLAVLAVFLVYNWRPARLFMGDGGSLVFGFLFASLGIALVESAGAQAKVAPQTVLAIISACLMVPAMDTLRVFYRRMRKGRSPFKADKSHLHHWFVKQHLVHSQATVRVIVFHVFLLLLSLVSIWWLPITLVILLQAATVLVYTKLLQLSLQFHRWYKFIKRLEAA